MIALKRQVNDPIYVDLKMRLNLTQSELNALIAKESALAGRIATNQTMLKNFPEDKKTLNDMELAQSGITRSDHVFLLLEIGC